MDITQKAKELLLAGCYRECVRLLNPEIKQSSVSNELKMLYWKALGHIFIQKLSLNEVRQRISYFNRGLISLIISNLLMLIVLIAYLPDCLESGQYYINYNILNIHINGIGMPLLFILLGIFNMFYINNNKSIKLFYIFYGLCLLVLFFILTFVLNNEYLHYLIIYDIIDLIVVTLIIIPIIIISYYYNRNDLIKYIRLFLFLSILIICGIIIFKILLTYNTVNIDYIKFILKYEQFKGLIGKLIQFKQIVFILVITSNLLLLSYFLITKNKYFFNYEKLSNLLKFKYFVTLQY